MPARRTHRKRPRPDPSTGGFMLSLPEITHEAAKILKQSLPSVEFGGDASFVKGHQQSHVEFRVSEADLDLPLDGFTERILQIAIWNLAEFLKHRGIASIYRPHNP